MKMILVSRVDQGNYLSDHCFVDIIIKAGIDPPPAKQITENSKTLTYPTSMLMSYMKSMSSELYHWINELTTTTIH